MEKKWKENNSQMKIINDQTSQMFQSYHQKKPVKRFCQGGGRHFRKIGPLTNPTFSDGSFTMDVSKGYPPAYSACRLQHVCTASKLAWHEQKQWQEQKYGCAGASNRSQRAGNENSPTVIIRRSQSRLDSWVIWRGESMYTCRSTRAVASSGMVHDNGRLWKFSM